MGMKLYSQEMTMKEGNILFSPFSIQSALSMVALGSKGSTCEQLMQFVGDKKEIKEKEDLKTVVGGATSSMKSKDGYIIESANAVFLQENFKILKSYKDDMEQHLGATISNIDYSNPKIAAETINKYVEDKTRNKIKDLVPESSIIPGLTKLILVNALYFKGLWDNQFKKECTRKETFYITKENHVKTDFMFQEEKQFVGKYKDKTIVALPYQGKRFVMYLFVPHIIREKDLFFRHSDDQENQEKNEEDISVLEADIINNPDDLADALNINKFPKKKVSLMLPRFKIEATMNLKTNLINNGVTDAFSQGKADLSDMSDQDSLYISDAVHKAFIEVNEEGSEAAAATAMMVGLTSIGAGPLPARFDRPFLFFIKDEETDVILFQARVADPTKS